MEWEAIIRLLVSAAVGGAIGLERAWRKKPAGMRTHVMVCLGACLIMQVSIFMGRAGAGGVVDPTRIASNVVVGIGFLGAGVIFHARGSVQGLTTAASLWAVGALGLAIGCGYYQAAAATTAIMLVTLHVFDRLEHYLVERAGPRARRAMKEFWFGGD